MIERLRKFACRPAPSAEYFPNHASMLGVLSTLYLFHMFVNACYILPYTGYPSIMPGHVNVALHSSDKNTNMCPSLSDQGPSSTAHMLPSTLQRFSYQSLNP